MKFIIQTINGDIKFDFQLELINSIEKHNFFYPNDKIEFIKTENPEKIDNPKDYCPIGSVEFVINYFKNNFGENNCPKPINIPKELLKSRYTKRHVDNILISDEFKKKHSSFNLKLFAKSNDVFKSENNGIYENGFTDMPNGNFQISSLIDEFKGEFRCFVYEGKLIDIRQYDGDFKLLPDFNLIYEMIDEYKSAPHAYTLDVGVTDKNETAIIEVHDFFSCGLYGFMEVNKLPFMFWRWYYYHVINI